MKDIEKIPTEYLDLRGLSNYSSLSIPCLRDHLKTGQLSHFKVKGKILVRRSDFDKWLERFRIDRKQDLDDIVEDAIFALNN